jgi:uncharacterized protein (AIM24 family)
MFPGMTLRKLDDSSEVMSPVATHVLRVHVTPGRPVRVRLRYILAERGSIEHRHEQHDLDEELRRQVERMGLSAAVNDEEFRKTATKRVDLDVAGGVALVGNLKAHRAEGEGEIWLGHEAGDISIFEVTDDSLVVVSQKEILAYDDTLAPTLEEVIPVAMAAVRNSTFAWILSGSGLIATATPGGTVVLDVTDDAPVRVESEALLAFTSGVELVAPEDFTQRATVRVLTWLVQFIPRVNIKLRREPVWMTARGTGTLVIRSGD